MAETNIRWASHSWNPYTWNCTKVSPGCANCYAATLSDRYGGANSAGGKFSGAAPQMRLSAWAELRRFPTGSTLFVNSMSDTFHEKVPAQFIHSIFNAAAYLRPDCNFLILTKRPEKAYAMRQLLAFPRNLWIGTSVENEEYLWRLNYLLRIPAAGHFISAEPLLGSLTGVKPYLKPHGDRAGLGWVIVGAESGKDRRWFEKAWARELRDLCKEAKVPFMFKQGSAFKSEQERVLDGREHNDSPFMIEKLMEPVVTLAPQQLTMF